MRLGRRGMLDDPATRLVVMLILVIVFIVVALFVVIPIIKGFTGG
jgi:hypothetical protein